jgi:hypothetical protein
MGMHSAALGRPNNSEWVSSLSRKADTMTRLNKSYVCLVIFRRFCPLDFTEYSFLMHFLFSVLLVRDSPNMAVSEQGRLHGDEELQSFPDISRRSRSNGLMNTQHPAMPRWSLGGEKSRLSLHECCIICSMLQKKINFITFDIEFIVGNTGSARSHGFARSPNTWWR